MYATAPDHRETRLIDVTPPPAPDHYRGRFAPSPTGRLHAGSLFTALASWVRARQAHGQWLVRMEDIDTEREVPGSAASMESDLARLGLASDAAVMYQSRRQAAYAAALETLRERDRVFPCWCSRRDLAAHGGLHRDGHCISAPDYRRPPAWRLRVADVDVTFEDGLQGQQRQNLRETAGDFVLRRADGHWAYQLACVVDDAAQGITEVVRGLDLLDSTPRQIHLQRQLGLPTPRYLHLPLITDASGRKLSKVAADRPWLDHAPDTALRTVLQLLGVATECLADTPLNKLPERAVECFHIGALAGRSHVVWPTT